ncbi:hypothetical protein D3C72_1891000 [compost metagenome]
MGTQVVEDAGQQGDMAGITDAQAKATLGRGRNELRLPGSQAPQRFQYLAAWPDQLVCPRGRGHAPGGAHEQRVVQFFTQAPQPDTHGRLTLAELFSATGHATAVIKHIEQLQQLGIRQGIERAHYCETQ